MQHSEEVPRWWGWPAWIEQEFLPQIRGQEDGPRDAQLWIISGPLESGRDDLFNVLHRCLLDYTESDGRVERLEREGKETAAEFQVRASLGLTARAGTLALAGGGGGADGMGVPSANPFPFAGAPAFFLLRDGDSLPVAWWRQTLGKWMAANPEGCLVTTVSHPSESIAEAFRQAGGMSRGLVHRSLGPWEEARIEAWRKEFMPHDQRSAGELAKYSNGGWPGFLWDLYEDDQRRSTNAAIVTQTRLLLEKLSTAEREFLLAAALGPAPARDFVEILLGREVPFAQWRTAFLHWESVGLVQRDNGWDSSIVPKVICEHCAELRVETGRMATDTIPALKILYGFLPTEEARRLVRPVGAFQHVEREGLEAIFGPRGQRMWDALMEVPGLVKAGVGPRALDPSFHNALRIYGKSLPGDADAGLAGRIRDAWDKRVAGLRSEIGGLQDKHHVLERRVEENRMEIQRNEKRLQRLRRKRSSVAAEVGRSDSRTSRSRPKHDGARQFFGSLTVLGAIGWIYLSFIQHNAFQVYPTIGGVVLLIFGFAAMMGSRDDRSAGVGRRRRDPAAEAAQLAEMIAGAHAQYLLSRETHDQDFRETSRLSAQIRQLEEALGRPYGGA